MKSDVLPIGLVYPMVLYTVSVLQLASFRVMSIITADQRGDTKGLRERNLIAHDPCRDLSAASAHASVHTFRVQ